MWVLLLLLTVIPLAGMGLVVAPSLRDSARVVAGTRTTEGHVDALNSLMVLRSTLYSEQVAAEAAVRAHDLGITLAVVSELLGFDIAGRVSTSRKLVDQAARVVTDQGLAVPAAFDTAIPRLRAEVDAGTADAEVLHGVFVDATQTLTDEVDRVLGLIVSSASATSGLVGGVEMATHRLVDVFDLLKAGQEEVNALFQSTMTTTEAVQADGRRSLTGARALYLRSLSTVERTASPGVAEMLTALQENDDVASFNAVVDAELDSSTGTGAPLMALGAAFRSSFVRSDLLTALLRTASDEASDIAGLRRDQADERLRNQILLMTALVLITTGAALAIAWSITRRLRPLAAKAERVSQGHLDDAPVDERGPREVAIVARALNEAAANLRHVELQASALASGDLDDPRLTVPAAGPLGESMQATVQRLLGAWQAGEQLQQRLAHQADHDVLTGLPNRKAALEGLEMALGRAHRHGDTVVVLFVDLDGFKRANDAHGHHVGDRILRTCADRMHSTVRAGDLLARVGGDEFLVITERIASVRDAVELSERLIASISEPIELDGITSRVGASIGIGISLDGHASALDLIRDAGNAVHRAKSLGQGRVEIFDEQARTELAVQSDLEAALRDSLTAGDLCLHYQPVTNTTTGELHGFEALARWTRDGISVPPDQFIPVAEQSDLINELGCWALTEATHQLAAWTLDGNYLDAYVAVNISGRHLLSAGFVSDVRHALGTSGLDPRRLVLEITETVIVHDLISAAIHLDELRTLGVRIALDDFGTGYTSIRQLWRLPIDILKIDGSFIRDLEIGHDQVIVQLIIEVAHTLGLGVIAECVETEPQHQALRDLSCDAIQGYLIAKPQSPAQLAAAASRTSTTSTAA